MPVKKVKKEEPKKQWIQTNFPMKGNDKAV